MPERNRAKGRSIGRRGLIPGAALALIGTSVAGCSSTAAPQLGIADVTVSEENPEAMVLRFSVQGENPNPFPLPLEEVRYRLELSGDRVFSGVRSAQITIPRSSSATLSLPVAFDLSDLGGGLNGPEPYRLSGSVRYRPEGTFPGVLFDAGVYRPVASFSASGTLDFSPAARTGPFPEASPENISVGEPDGGE